MLVFLFLVWRAAVPEPFADMFTWIERLYRFRADGDLGAYLFAPHNEHRLAWTFLLLDVDARVCAGGGWILIGAALVGMAITAGLLAREATLAAPPQLAPAAGAVGAMVTLMAANVLDVSIPINTNYVHALGFAVAAVILAETEGPRVRAARLAAALACACAAAFGDSVGLVAWPALALGAVLRRDWKAAAAISACGAAFIAGFLLIPPAIWPTPASDTPRDLVASLLVFLNFLGLPFVRALPQFGWLAGAALVALATLLTWIHPARFSSRGSRIAVQLVLLTLLAAALAAVGRTDQGPPQNVPIRYSVFLAPAHVGLLILALPWAAKMQANRSRLFAATSASLLVLLLAQQVVMADFAMRTVDLTRGLIVNFHEGRREPAVVQVVSPDIGLAANLDARLRRDRLFQGSRYRPAPSRGLFGRSRPSLARRRPLLQTY